MEIINFTLIVTSLVVSVTSHGCVRYYAWLIPEIGINNVSLYCFYILFHL